MAGRSLRSRLALTGAVVAAGAAGAALALGAEGDGAPPSIDVDSGAPLFTLSGMRPGDPGVERCIAVRTSGGSAPRLSVSGAVAGALAASLRMEVAAGQGPAPGDGHSCTGFVPERELWGGALVDFPRDGAAAIDAAPLPSGGSRVYRFRVELPADAGGAGGQQATQDIRWTAELEPDVPSPGGAPPAGGGASSPVTGAGGAPTSWLGCAMLVGALPRRSLTIGGRRVTLIVGQRALVAADAPLVMRLGSAQSAVRSVSYRVDGRVVRARRSRPWTARVAPSLLHAPRTSITATVTPVRGRRQTVAVTARVRPCPTRVRADAASRAIRLRLDSNADLRGATITLPRGIASGAAHGRVTTWADGRRLARPLKATGSPSVTVRGRRVEVAGLRAGTSAVEIRLDLPRRVWRALRAAGCARAAVTARVATAAGIATIRVRLLGDRGSCAR
jgi:hypothetical protein